MNQQRYPKIWKSLYGLLFGCLATTGLLAQSRIDILKNNIATAKDTNAKLAATLAFCNEWDSYSPDTLRKYASLAQQQALVQKDTKSALLAGFYQAAYLYQKNKLDSAELLATDLFNQYKKLVPYDGTYMKFYRLRTNTYLRATKYDACLKLNLELLKLAEEHADTMAMASATMGIGNVHNRLQEKDQALAWYYKALALMRDDALKIKFSFIYNNIAIVHYKEGNEDSMFYFIKQGLQYSKLSGNLTDHANSLFLYAGMLAEFKQLEAAETNFKLGLAERKSIGDVYYIVADMAQLALFYLNSNQPQKGIDICLEGLELAKKNGYPNVDELYQSLARNYKAAGQYDKATEILEQFIIFKDSVYGKNSADVLGELQTRYDVQKKENTIIQQKFDLTRKNYFIYGTIGLLAATLLFGYFFLSNRKKNQRLKMQAFEMEQKKKTTQAVMEAEEEERKRIAGDLHDSVAQKMVVAKLNLEALGNELQSMNASQQNIFNNINALLDESSTEVRSLSHSMMPLAFSRSGLTDTVKDFLDKIFNPQLRINFSADGNFKILDENTGLMMYRIIQECVQNVLKHAESTNLDIAMMMENDEIDITIEDNGKGFDASNWETSESVGIKSIRSRTAYLNGKLEIKSQQKKGTLIAIYIPLNQI